MMTLSLKNIKRTSYYILALLLSLFVLFRLLDYFYPIPEINKLKKFSQLVVDKNGRPLRAFADKKGVWRYPTNHKKVSPEYLQALINYEDRQFWSHSGVNYLSMVRAAKQWLMNGRAISGGSTLTMQVARILDPHQRNVGGKLWQIFRAYQLEYHYSKSDILNLYLNYAPFGGPIEGIEAATFTYLGKSAEYLTTAEAALMAVLPQSPSRFRPDRYPERAERARNKVLDRMVSFNVWNAKKVLAAKQEVVIAEFNSRPLIAPLLARFLKNSHPNTPVIETNIDLDIQLSVADRVKQYLFQFSEHTSASALLMDNQTLDVVAYVGAADFANQKRFGHIDMNRAIRSPGSTLKPFIYAMALEQGLIHSASLLQDVPLNFDQYTPENFTKNYSGPVSVSHALQASLNIPAVQVLSHLGAEKFSSQLANGGLKLYLPQGAQPSLSLALGGAGVRLFDLVAAYRSLVSHGLSGKPRYLKQQPIEERYLLSPESAWIVADILAQVPLMPTQKSRFFKQQQRWLAHKTGTSYGYRDAWMVAVSPQYTLAVWVGKPDGTPSPGEFGRKTAAPLVAQIFALLDNNAGSRWGKIKPIKKPHNVNKTSICWPLGLTQALTKASHCHQIKQAYLIEQISPKTLQQEAVLESSPLMISTSINSSERVFLSCYSGEINNQQVALWPSRLDYWLPSEYTRKNLLPPLDTNCLASMQLNHELIIVGVENNSKISKSPENNTALELDLEVIASRDKLTWLVNGKKVAETAVGKSLLLKNLTKGIYKVMVFNKQNQMGLINFEVI